MREIVLDTETTGFDPGAGHRIAEVACLELLHHVPTGKTFQKYVNPERDMPEEAQAIHGLSSDFLAGHPLFGEIVGEFLDFIGDSPLVIHNAQFDLKFLNAELARLEAPPLESERAIDTVILARRRFPGAQASLDALCRRFGIDNSARAVHGALLDCQLLAEVYLQLCGGRQPGFDLAQAQKDAVSSTADQGQLQRPLRAHEPTSEERAAHELLLEKIKAPVWRQ